MVGFLPLEAVDPLSPSSPALGLREVVASIAPFFVGFSPEWSGWFWFMLLVLLCPIYSWSEGPMSLSSPRLGLSPFSSLYKSSKMEFCACKKIGFLIDYRRLMFSFNDLIGLVDVGVPSRLFAGSGGRMLEPRLDACTLIVGWSYMASCDPLPQQIFLSWA